MTDPHRRPVKRQGPPPPEDAAALPGLLGNLIGFTLKRAQVRAGALFAEALGEFDLTENQFGILIMIAEHPELSQVDVGGVLGIDRSTMVGALNRLERRGLIRRTPSSADRRVHALLLTEEGFQLLVALRPALANYEDRIAAALSPEERKNLPDMLHRLAREQETAPPSNGLAG